ncbi:MAG: CPBP family intramembrane metalloprotease [Muribaculaceae bacterium]|nr:CPBP family intramembrane metalloprotease [Muribaculaceae bacterium]
MNLALTMARRLMLLICIFVIGFFIVGVLSTVVVKVFGASTPALRIITVFQDILVFILPAIVTALMVTRRGATLLSIDRAPSLNPTLIAICTLLCSIPAMNYVIWLNTNIPLPQHIHDALMDMEQSANSTIETLMGPHTVPNLIVSVLIVGVLAGLSEEIFFRGGLQRLLVTGGVNHHVAIWTTAFFFSMLHMQFFGLVPRMLLGAFFGYLLYWTGSLWIPILLHALNNSIYVVAGWMSYGNDSPSAVDAIGSGTDIAYVAISVVLTAMGLVLLQRTKTDNSEQ